MNREEISEKFNCIVKAFTEGALNTLSIAQLEDYHAFLLEHGAHDGINETTYFQLCEHVRTLIALKNKEKSDETRHQEIQKKLEELKKPHWTVNTTFWVSLVAMTAACIAAFFTVFPRSSQPANGGQKSLGTKRTVQSAAANLQKQLSSSQQVSHREKQK